MADVYTAPSTEVAGTTLPAADWNTYVRDNQTALQLGLKGDNSSDADALHAHSAAAAGTAPPTASYGGRLHLPDGQIYGENNAGTGHHCYGPGPYDDMVRANSSTITPSASGHAWVEESGDWSIATNTLKVGTSGIATLNTQALLTRRYSVNAIFELNPGTNDCRLILKFADVNNYIYVKILDTNEIHIRKVIAGVDALIGSALTGTDDIGDGVPGNYWHVEAHVWGLAVQARVFKSFGVSNINVNSQTHADVQHANLAAATKVGVGFPNSFDACASIWVDF